MRQVAGRSCVYSRLRSELPQVVEELRQVCLQQTLKLQAQGHDSLQGHTSRALKTRTEGQKKALKAGWLTEGEEEMECSRKK